MLILSIKQMARIIDADIYTLVNTQDCEFVLYENKYINIYVPLVENLHINFYNTKRQNLCTIYINKNTVYFKSQKMMIMGRTCLICDASIDNSDKTSTLCGNCINPLRRIGANKQLHVNCDGKEMSCPLPLNNVIDITVNNNDIDIKIINKINESREHVLCDLMINDVVKSSTTNTIFTDCIKKKTCSRCICNSIVLIDTACQKCYLPRLTKIDKKSKL